MRIIQENSLDAIIGWMWNTHLLSGLAALISGISSFSYELDYPSNRTFLRKIVNLIPVQGVITLSKLAYEQQNSIFPNRRSALVYPGVDITKFDAKNILSVVQARKKLGLPEEGIIIGIVGRMQRWKGIHVLIQSMPYILQKYPTLKCVVVGGKHDLEPDYVDFVQQLVVDLELESKIIFTGQQSNIPEWTQSLDVVVHASSNEPFGIVVIEAMALQKPVVAGSDGGPSEIITHEVDGLLSPYGDYISLSNSILRYLDNPEFANRVSLLANQRSHDFSTQKYAENFVGAIKKFMA